MSKVKTDSGGEVADAEHAHEGSSIFHARRSYARRAAAKRWELAVFVEKCSDAVQLHRIRTGAFSAPRSGATGLRCVLR